MRSIFARTKDAQRWTMTDVPSLILNGIREFANSRPRTLQKEVGPSQLGNPCDHCLAAALAGWEKVEQDTPWLPLIGTAVHALLLTPEAFPGWLDLKSNEYHGWATEQRVNVGQVAGRNVAGNADLFHIATGTVVDLKIVGATTLNEARRHGSKHQYRRQINLYGRGFHNAGYDVNRVIIAYLPRNSMRLSDAFFDEQPYDENNALETLARADRIAVDVARYTYISRQARDVFIDGLPRVQGCYDCARYPSIVQRPSELAMFATGRA